ncbi:MAG: RsmB/NOP family class I SAM-dependent RNA methyltransferase [Candidatus Anstonellales archaeon]
MNYEPLEKGLEESIIRCLSSLKKYIRVNTLAITPSALLNLLEDVELEKTPLPDVFSINAFKPGALPEFKAGLIHVQSFSSCLVPLAFSSLNKFDVILDATASPGSKTSHMAALMKNEGAIIANDRKNRHRALISTLSRLGIVNTGITSYDAKKLPWKDYFTKCLLDAPCSALGSHINAWKRLEINKNLPKTMSKIQKAMILSCFDSLKRNGELVYSTCTITTEENENVIDFLIEKRDNAKLMHFSLPIKCEKGEQGFMCRDYVKRIYPWHVESEAFFIAKIKKI